MPLYWSHRSIPELARLPRKRQAQIWNSVYKQTRLPKRVWLAAFITFLAALCVVDLGLLPLIAHHTPFHVPVSGLQIWILQPLLAAGFFTLVLHLKIKAALPELRRRIGGFCITCGYDLTGNVTGICPECGTPLIRPYNRAMTVDVALVPTDLRPGHLADRAVVVFDVLRATTTMTAALAAGIAEIRIFDSLAAAKSAATEHHAPLLCGEQKCLPPPGFDLGNSPGAFAQHLHSQRTVFMSTTNGTRAIVAAREAKLLLIGAVVNATAVAKRLAAAGLDLTLLCAGTDGHPAMEDLIGAGAVIDALGRHASLALQSDTARIALRLFLATRPNLHAALSDAAGGLNVIAAGLGADVECASRLDSLTVVGEVRDDPLRVVRME